MFDGGAGLVFANRKCRDLLKRLLAIFSIVFVLVNAAEGISSANTKVKIKNIVNIIGVRPNILVGLGVVFGLQGTGDSAASIATTNSVASMLAKMGMKAKGDSLVAGNFASVIVTAELPAFARSGDRINVRLSAHGDASSLAGGTLLMTHLKAGDRQTYVIAQGAVVMGEAVGAGSSVLTTANVPNGGIVEREFESSFIEDGRIRMALKIPDFTSNRNIVVSINKRFKGFYARSIDKSTIEVAIPPSFKSNTIDFISQLEQLQVEVDQKAVIVLNEKTGTIAIGKDVIVSPCVIAHGDLSIKISKNEQNDSEQSLVDLGGPTVGEVVRSLNRMGVKPSDLISIVQAIHESGSLHGDLKIQ